jgi:hypothetical protein
MSDFSRWRPEVGLYFVNSRKGKVTSMKMRQIFQLLFFTSASVFASASVHAEQKTVRLIYIVPSDVNPIDLNNRVDTVDSAVENNRQLWSRYGATFTADEMVVIKSDKDVRWFLESPDGYHGVDAWYWLGNACNEAKTIYPEACNLTAPDQNHKYIIFLDMAANPRANASAAANFGAAIMPKGIIDGIMRGDQSDIGSIGHELGHTFGIEHENCDQQVAPKGMMCNGGNYPNVQLNQYHFNSLFSPAHKDFFAESNASSCRLEIRSEWNTGYSAAIVISNPSSVSINGWKIGLILPTGHSVSDSWSSNRVKTGMVNYFTPMQWNQVVAPNSNIEFGFNAVKENSTPANQAVVVGDVCK